MEEAGEKIFLLWQLQQPGCYLQKNGEKSQFSSLLSTAWGWIGREMALCWVGMLQEYSWICAEMRGNPNQAEEFGMVTLLPKSICFPKSELNYF